MDAKTKAEQDVLSAADCWARGVMQSDRVLDLTERNLLDAVMVLDRLLKHPITDPSHLPPPPNLPHDMDPEDQIPTVRYSDHSTIPSPVKDIEIVIEDSILDSDDIF